MLNFYGSFFYINCISDRLLIVCWLLMLFVGGASAQERRERAERRDDAHQRADGARDDVEWRQATHGGRLPVNAR